MEGQLREVAKQHIIDNYGSEEEYERKMDEIRKINLREGIIDYEQLKEFFESRIPGFDTYYRNYISKNKPPLMAYEFLSFLLRPFIEECSINDHHKLMLIWDTLEYLLEHGDEAVKNELKVVVGEEVELKVNYRYMGKLTKLFLAENQIYPGPNK